VHKVVLEIDGAIVTEGERAINNGVPDRSPEVEDLESLLEESWNILWWEVSVHAGECGFCGLVNVGPHDRLAGVWAGVE